MVSKIKNVSGYLQVRLNNKNEEKETYLESQIVLGVSQSCVLVSLTHF